MTEPTYATVRTEWAPGYVRLYRGGLDRWTTAELSNERRTVEFQLVFHNLKNTFHTRGGGNWEINERWDGWMIFNDRDEIVVDVTTFFPTNAVLILEPDNDDAPSATGSPFRETYPLGSPRKKRHWWN